MDDHSAHEKHAAIAELVVRFDAVNLRDVNECSKLWIDNAKREIGNPMPYAG
jgi:hypothetical protein